MIFRGLEDVLADGRGVERAFQCHMHDDHNASASVNVELGLWICYACGARGGVDGHIPDPAAVLRVLEAPEERRVYPEEWLDLFDSTGPAPYWSARFGDEVAARMRCGVHPVTGSPCYPVRSLTGAVWGVVERAVSPADGSPRYKYPYGVRTAHTLFSSHSRLVRAPVAVLVEGAADVMALMAAGLPEGWQVLGCYGAGLHAPQIEALVSINIKLAVLAFDADTAGRNATERAISQLDGVAPTVSVDWSRFTGASPIDVGVTAAKDPGDVPLEGRIATIEAAIHHHTKGTP